jgi:polyisoprenoid-binding protein YceI
LRFRSRLRSLLGSCTRTLPLLALLLCLTLSACFGSSESDQVAEAANAPAAPVQEAPTAAPTETAADATPAAAPTEAAPAQEATSEVVPAAGERQLFQIDPAQSEARFIVDEVLFGNPNTVTGRTNEVSGQIEIDLGDPTQTTVGEIQVNARALATDNRFRNRSVNRLILQSNRDEYQFITFTPTAIEGLPAQATVGNTFSFQMTGDLKIREIVQPTTFEVTVTADSATQISGLAQTVVQRADFELTIPNVKGVADVTEEVRLELDFVATASE